MHSKRAAAIAAIARNRALLLDNDADPEVYLNQPSRLFDAIVWKWIPYHYGDERDNRDFTYGDELHGERHYARVIGFNKPYWRIEYEVDGEVEDCTLDEILRNLDYITDALDFLFFK